MAQRTALIDDFDGSPAVETVQFGYSGRDYAIDLNEEHAAELDEYLASYIEHARRVDGRGHVRPRRSALGRHDPEIRKIREWARAQGLTVNDRGRLPQEILEKYEAAHTV